MLPEELSIEDCHALDKLFDIKDAHDHGLLTPFYACAIQSGYKDIFPKIEEMFSNYGRYSLLGIVFRALVKAEWSRELARPLFERYREKHHPITVARIEHILKEADL